MPAPEPTVRATRYEVSCLPPDDINTRHFTITVEYRGHGRWAVLDGPFALDADGEPDYEPRSSICEDEWLSSHRFDLNTALELAKKTAPLMTVHGRTVDQALAIIAAREAAGV